MTLPAQNNLLPKPMTEATFRQFSRFIQTQFGIKMPGVKKNMLQTRLQKRMRCLCINSYDEYRDYVFSPRGQQEELQHMIDVVTTNKTDFFREPKHFNFICETVIPTLIGFLPEEAPTHVSVWSAGCSSGQEPYTLAMVFSELAEIYHNLRFSILATDLSMKMLQTASDAIYPSEEVKPISMKLKKKYLLRSKDGPKNLVRITPKIRSLVTFRRLNLMADDFEMRETMDIIFCRNVLIYFERSDQEKIVARLCRQLNPGGFLFIGHSETLGGMDVPLTPVIATVYRKTI